MSKFFNDVGKKIKQTTEAVSHAVALESTKFSRGKLKHQYHADCRQYQEGIEYLREMQEIQKIIAINQEKVKEYELKLLVLPAAAFDLPKAPYGDYFDDDSEEKEEGENTSVVIGNNKDMSLCYLYKHVIATLRVTIDTLNSDVKKLRAAAGDIDEAKMQQIEAKFRTELARMDKKLSELRAK